MKNIHSFLLMRFKNHYQFKNNICYAINNNYKISNPVVIVIMIEWILIKTLLEIYQIYQI